MLAFCVIYVGSNLFLLHHLPTILTSEKKLQQLSANQDPMIEINQYTRQGWPQFLGRNMAITVVPLTSLSTLQWPKIATSKPRWVIAIYPWDKVKHYHDVYPLQFSLQRKHPLPILMPYSVYQQLTH